MKDRSLSIRAALQLAPTIGVLLFVFVLPTAYFFVISFWRVRAFKLRPEFTFDQYRQVLAEFSDPLQFTLALASVVAIVTVLIALGFAYFCRFQAGPAGPAFIFLVLVTLFGGYLTKIYMWKTILGSAGILNTALMELGLIDSPITALLYSPVAVIITLVHYTLPLAILPIYGALRGVEDVPLEAARDLGAGRLRTFFDIVLPQIRSGIVAAFSLSFIFTAGDYVTPLMVGGPNASMIGVFIQNQFGNRLNSPLGSALSFVVIASCMVIVLAFATAMVSVTRSRR
ncbi:ABC transporter permease [Mesorhizobium sp. KR9-304]|uniref:ABC transporter permease n=1 Tax=Mesorhizobium sp. KR9-304 TaxID=3156614 RepID=UPI0032B43A0F